MPSSLLQRQNDAITPPQEEISRAKMTQQSIAGPGDGR